MGASEEFKVKFCRCATAEECLAMCGQGKYVQTTPEVLLEIAGRLDRSCVVLVEGASDGPS